MKQIVVIMAVAFLTAMVSCGKKDEPAPSSQDSTKQENTKPSVVVKIPELTTHEVYDIQPTTAKCGGKITNYGGGIITERGICWGYKPEPTVNDARIWATDTANLTAVIQGLDNNTTYYVRAYAINSAGVGYGQTVSFLANKVGDVEGNVYTSVAIGNQVWLVENLRSTKFRNGDLIDYQTDTAVWRTAKKGLYCNYNDDALLAQTYGRLYNWYTISDARGLAPEGWHVATRSDWDTLITHLKGYDNAGGALKEVGLTHWDTPNAAATNTSGFTALPGGYFYFYESLFDGKGYMAYWWSATAQNTDNAYSFNISSNSGAVAIDNPTKVSGFAVRCVKN